VLFEVGVGQRKARSAPVRKLARGPGRANQAGDQHHKANRSRHVCQLSTEAPAQVRAGTSAGPSPSSGDANHIGGRAQPQAGCFSASQPNCAAGAGPVRRDSAAEQWGRTVEQDSGLVGQGSGLPSSPARARFVQRRENSLDGSLYFEEPSALRAEGQARVPFLTLTPVIIPDAAAHRRHPQTRPP
jgi:hypothetical protein